MSYYFRCVRCDLNFDNENAFTYHASARNAPAVSKADEEGVVQVPTGVSPCVARVICRNCYRSYQKVKGYKEHLHKERCFILLTTNANEHRCNECGRSFLRDVTLIHHTRHRQKHGKCPCLNMGRPRTRNPVMASLDNFVTDIPAKMEVELEVEVEDDTDHIIYAIRCDHDYVSSEIYEDELVEEEEINELWTHAHVPDRDPAPNMWCFAEEEKPVRKAEEEYVSEVEKVEDIEVAFHITVPAHQRPSRGGSEATLISID